MVKCFNSILEWISFLSTFLKYRWITYEGHSYCCRELLLCHNLIRSLPYEIGKLFHLQILGLQGNPINKECLKIYNEPNGTHKLLSFLLDSLAGKFIFSLRIFYTFLKSFFIFLFSLFFISVNCKWLSKDCSSQMKITKSYFYHEKLTIG